jgi:hypothetical protein
MDRERLVSLIQDDKTSPNRRRLYFTMLGVCGQPEDTKMLEALLTSGSRKKMRGLEALIACYLNLKGADGMELIQKEFFENKDSEFTYTMLAMQALRFHAEETDIIPKDRIVAAARIVLDNEEARDLVIPDLARWEDWSVMGKLVDIFKNSGEDNNWIRVPIASYLMACPLPQAKVHLKELEKLDPSSIARARFLDGEDFDDFDDEVDGSEDVSSGDEDAGLEQSFSDFDIAASSAQFVSMTDGPPLTRHTVRKVEQPAAALESPSETPNNFEETFVSRKSGSSQSNTNQVARGSTAVPATSTPVVASVTNLTWQIIFIPMGVSILLFVLLWSVLSGWFERLIF